MPTCGAQWRATLARIEIADEDLRGCGEAVQGREQRVDAHIVGIEVAEDVGAGALIDRGTGGERRQVEGLDRRVRPKLLIRVQEWIGCHEGLIALEQSRDTIERRQADLVAYRIDRRQDGGFASDAGLGRRSPAFLHARKRRHHRGNREPVADDTTDGTRPAAAIRSAGAKSATTRSGREASMIARHAATSAVQPFPDRRTRGRAGCRRAYASP